MKARFTSLTDIQKDLRTGNITFEKLASHYLAKAEASKDYNVYLEIYHDEVKTKSKELDEKFQAGKKMGKLAGLFLSVKDVICHAGKEVTASSAILKGYKSPYTASVLQKILDEDAIVIGRVNCDEFAMGSSNENSVYGPVRNPYDPQRVPGGSSGGSAVSVSLDTCLCALGSDTGGSIRQPASFCHLYGLKPSYGRLSRYGLIAYASSFDQLGFIGRNIDDLEKLLEVGAGKDIKDATSTGPEYQQIKKPINTQFKLAYWAGDSASVDEQILSSYQDLIDKIKDSVEAIVPCTFSTQEYLVPAYYILTTAEASSNLTRFDGIRYGPRAEGDSIDDIVLNTRTKYFGEEVKRRLMMGTYVLSSGYYEAYYAQAQKTRSIVISELNALFEEADAIILPVSPVLPWKLGTVDHDPVKIYLADVFTVIANLAGLPAISIPVGFSKEGLPIGVQIIGPRFSENQLTLIAKHIAKKIVSDSE